MWYLSKHSKPRLTFSLPSKYHKYKLHPLTLVSMATGRILVWYRPTIYELFCIKVCPSSFYSCVISCLSCCISQNAVLKSSYQNVFSILYCNLCPKPPITVSIWFPIIPYNLSFHFTSLPQTASPPLFTTVDWCTTIRMFTVITWI
jgi:hypothetical protein